MEEKKQNRKILYIPLPIALHGEIKILAAKRNVSIKAYVLKAIAQLIEKEKKYE